LTQVKLAGLVNLIPKYIGEIARGKMIASNEALLRTIAELKPPIREFFRNL